MTETFEWIECRIHDKKHFTARYLSQLSSLCGMKPANVAKVVCGCLIVVLTFSDYAQFIANFILTVVPLLLIFVHSDEKPSDESLFVYCTCFGIVTLFDKNLENIPFYYILKLFLFMLFYTPPYKLHQRIYDLFRIDPAAKNKSQRTRSETIVKTNSSSTRTALPKMVSSKSCMSTDKTQRTVTPSPLPVQSKCKNSDVKVTVIEEYYREEVLLSPSGTVIDRVVKGPFRRETTRTESNSGI